MSENELSYKIRGAIFKVFNFLGPGLLESTHEAALTHELKKNGLEVQRQVRLPIIYDGAEIKGGYRMIIAQLAVHQRK